MEQPKAVLCDDDRTSTLILKRLLEKAGFAVFCGNNGKEGLALVSAQHPRLVILDLDMPQKNGFQVLIELRQAGGPLPYIIVLTAHESSSDEIRVKALGAREMVVKPFTPSELVRKLQELVSSGIL